jgi:glycosyltransferase involved in cell wall biosynthesis
VNVSVIIPAYNAAPWIRETLESVLAQDVASLETIVVDDGSTDDTAGIVAKYGHCVRYVRQARRGPGATRNLGIKLAQGDHIAFVDADDIWLPKKIRLQSEALQQSGLAWVYSDAYAFDAQTGAVLCRFSQLGRLYRGDVLKPLFFRNFIGSSTPVIRRTVFADVGLFDSEVDLHSKEDWDMWLRIAARYPAALVNVPLARYRVSPRSRFYRSSVAERLRAQIAVLDRAVVREPSRLAPLRSQGLARLYVDAGCISVREGDVAQGRRLFAKAIRLAPCIPRPYVYWLSCLVGQRVLNPAMGFRHWLRSKRA